MKNTLVLAAVSAVLGTASFNASAVASGDTLSITAGGSEVTSCLAGTINPATGICNFMGTDNAAFNVTSQTGSFFNLGGTDTNISGFNGIVLGAIQDAAGAHTGGINGNEQPNIDNPWFFASNTGMHQTTSPITVVSQTELDFAGWNVTWGTESSIPMGGCSLLPDGCVTAGGTNVNTGIATIAITGDNYVLDYFANVPVGAPFGGAGYTLHLEGTITSPSAVPVPAAVWLFGSGLVGLAGIARRKKASA